MFVDFIYELRAFGVPVGATEAVRLAEAMSKGLHENSLDGFYYVSRALLVHSERHLDLFDQAFLKHFKGIEVESKKLTDDLLEWLKKAKGGLLGGAVKWNFTKFLVGADGQVIRRYAPTTTPQSIADDVEAALAR